jgi:hypothetical protein
MGFVEEPTAIESKDVLTVYLAKYGTLRAETSSRFQFQAQAFNFLVVVLTAGVVASSTLIGGEHGGQFNRLVLILPLVAGPLGYLYLSNDLMIFGIASYLDRELSREVSALVGRDIVLTDARLDHLSPRGRTTLAALAYSRWLLFVVPTVAPVVYVALATNVWAEYPFSLLFVADCVIALGLLAAIWATAREQVAWRQQHSRLTATAPPIAAATPEMDTDGA